MIDFDAKILADSIANGPQGPVRLTTVQATIPRMILSELNTHRVFSRGSASSRAIPVKKKIKEVFDSPFVPEAFGRNQPGMSSDEELDTQPMNEARAIWLDAMQDAVEHANRLAELGVHKQWANRLLEPFSWHTVIITATDWDNFFALRIHKDAQPEMQRSAKCIKDAMDASVPTYLVPGQWHMPYIREEDREAYLQRSDDPYFLQKLSVARSARVSYFTFGERKINIEADLELHDKLYEHHHMSPFEHVAIVGHPGSGFTGNFREPWQQYRKIVENNKEAK